MLRLVPLEILTATLIMKTEPISTSLHLISNLKEKILDSTGFSGKTGIILGSGLGALADSLTDKKTVSFSELDGFPVSTVEGHSGEFLSGTLTGTDVMLASGRFHLYEGYDFDTVTIPVKLFRALGIENLIITNSSGSIKKNNPPGTLMAITGHLDCTFRHSIDDPVLQTASVYHDPELIALAEVSAEELGIEISKGTYCWTLGPSYETTAEIEFFDSLGGDAVGMSTVPEIITAGELGMRTLTIACLTNYATGVSKEPLTHQDVLETARKSSASFIALIQKIIENLKQEED